MKGFSKKSLYSKSWFIVLAFLAFFKPICFQYYSSLLFIDRFFVYLKIIISIIILCDYLCNRCKINFGTAFVKWVTVFELWIFCVTYIGGGAIFRACIDCVSMIVLSLFTINAMLTNGRFFLLTIILLQSFLISIHVVSELIYPLGMPADLYMNHENPLYFLTIDNGTASRTILCITTMMVAKYLYKDLLSKRTYLCILSLCLGAAILSNSATAILTTALISVFFILRTSRIRLLSNKNFWLFLYILIVGLIFMQNSGLLSVLFATTGRENFTGRSYLWLESVRLIKDSPIYGYGRQEQDYLEIWGGFYSSHNIYLEVMLQGGIIALLLLLNIIIRTFDTIHNSVNKVIYSSFYACIFTILIALMMEAFVHNSSFFLMLALLYIVSFKKERKCCCR